MSQTSLSPVGEDHPLPAKALGIQAWLQAFTKGVDAIAHYGGAQRGHRTMVKWFKTKAAVVVGCILNLGNVRNFNWKNMT